MNLTRWLKEKYDIKLVLISKLETPGYYLHSEKLMFVKAELSDEEITTVVLHELGHYLKDEDVIGSYEDCIARSKMEYLANYYMIEHTLDTWCNTNDIDLKDVNCTTFLSANNLSPNYIPIVEMIVRNKVEGIIKS